jgi:HD-like signal output (HDOD) protein
LRNVKRIGKQNAAKQGWNMSAKTILLAIADPQALADISEALGTGWMPTAVRNEPEAVSQLKRFSFNAFLVDFNLGSPDASELLDLALAEHPETARFLMAYEADLSLVAAKVNGPHHLLSKPLEFALLKNRIEEGVAEQNSNGTEQGKDAAGGQRASTKIPPVYAEVLKALEAPEVTSEQVGELIGTDEALTAEVLRLACSSKLGLPRNFSGPAEAVESLGMGAVKTLVMALRHLAEHSQLKPGYLSLDALWQHSTRVAQLARDLVLFETKDRSLAEEAFAAGLVHDLGKVVLVKNFDDLYGRVHSLARNQPVALWDVEREMFGANHGEIGGCLVGMWNLPGPVVEATAFHHEPTAVASPQLTALAAVQIADVLEHELWPSEEFKVAPAMDTGLLSGLGLLERLPVWRAACRSRELASLDPELEPAEHEPMRVIAPRIANLPPPRAAEQLAEPTAVTHGATAVQVNRCRGTERVRPSRASAVRWVYAGVATALLLVTLWLTSRAGSDAPDPVQARARHEAPSAASPPPVPEPAAVVGEAVEPPPVNPVETPAAETPAVAQQAPATLVAEPVRGATPQSTVRSGPPPGGTPPAITTSVTPPGVEAKKPTTQFRINGIFYTVSRPMAIVNGVTVSVGEKVDGATVVSIGPSRVTLRTDGELKTLALE